MKNVVDIPWVRFGSHPTSKFSSHFLDPKRLAFVSAGGRLIRKREGAVRQLDLPVVALNLASGVATHVETRIVSLALNVQ